MCFYLRNWQVTFLLYTLGVFISEYTAKAFTEPRDYRVVFLIQSPEVPNGTFRDCKRSPRSRASPDFGSLPIQKNRPYRSRNKDGYFRGTTLIHRIAEHRRFQSHSGTITYTTPSQPTHHLPFYIRGNGFSCTAGQTSFQCEAPGCIHRFVSRASHQPAAFCHHVHLLLLPFKAYII